MDQSSPTSDDQEDTERKNSIGNVFGLDNHGTKSSINSQNEIVAQMNFVFPQTKKRTGREPAERRATETKVQAKSGKQFQDGICYFHWSNGPK